MADLLTGAAARIDSNESLTPVVDALIAAAAAVDDGARQAAHDDVAEPFRVVLMGSTMAGKSSLFEYLTGGDGARVGDGAPRFSRDSMERPITVEGLESVVLVDVPGVAAFDAPEDREEAFRQAQYADLVLWTQSTTAAQEETGRALERLADLGKPLVVALNCRSDVTNPLNRIDLLQEPERIFGGDVEEYMRPIERYLARAAGRYAGLAKIHAQAACQAQFAVDDPTEAEQLRSASRVVDLVDLIRAEQDATATQRRLVRVADIVRVPLSVAHGLADQLATTTASQEVAAERRRVAVGRKSGRAVDDAALVMKTAIRRSVEARRRWVAQLDVDLKDSTINDLWRDEVTSLNAEVRATVSQARDRLRTSLSSIVADADAEWARTAAREFEGLDGGGSARWNLAAKIIGHGGLTVAALLGGAKGGAALGGVVGTLIGGPPGTAIGAAIGGAVGVLVGGFASGAKALRSGINKIADSWFRSKKDVHARRRRQLTDQFGPLLDDVEASLDTQLANEIEAWRGAIADEDKRAAASVEAFEAATRVVYGIQTSLSETVAELDLRLTRGLLAEAGRGRLAGAVTRATRLRGAGIAVDLAGDDLTEAILYPPERLVETLTPVPSSSSRGITAFHVLRGATDGKITVASLTRDNVHLHLGSPVPDGVLSTWRDLAQLHSGADAVRLTQDAAEEIAS
ncbi:GTPase [Xylanimonas ulmi]|uniref:GTPase n=1 Tax=Xylanimonas ulmi TaxID=228973 RepID=UPI0013EEC407|nr:GTPase domain-containing protein [Xylanibacterium ulmi]